MFRLIITLSLLAAAIGSEVFQQCIDSYTTAVSNDYLQGTWHQVYRFTFMGSQIPTATCYNITFSIPTPADINEYKAKYDNAGFPFTLDGNSLHSEVNKDSTIPDKRIGLYAGTAEAKFFVLDPKSAMVIASPGYAVDVFQRYSDNYVIYWPCAMRSNEMYIMSRQRNPPVEEMLHIIENTPALKRLFAQRQCVV